MNQRRSLVLVLAVTVLFGLFVFSASAKEEAGTPVFQSPLPAPSASAFFSNWPTAPVGVNAEFTFELWLGAANFVPGLAGAEVYIGYPANLVEPVALPGQPIATVLPDFFGVPIVSVNEITTWCPGGVSPCARLAVAGPPQTTRQGAIGRYHFRPLVAGDVCFTLLSVALADANGVPVTNTVSSPLCVTAIDLSHTTSGLVQRQGTPATSNVGGGTLGCSRVKVSTSQSALTDATGNFTLTISANTFSIEASYSGYLKAVKNLSLPADGQSYSVGTVRLLGGDANGDGRINIQDISVMLSEFSRSSVPVLSAVAGCTGVDDPNDINDDGLVNISDVAITTGNWNKVGPTVWP